MEISQVLNILQLTEMPPSDVLENLVEDEVFHLRDYFLRNPVVKQLYVARIRKLNKLLEIQEHYLKNKVNHSLTCSHVTVTVTPGRVPM